MKVFARLAACAALSLVAIVPAQASIVADQGEYVSHTVDCLGLLLTDPAAHAAQCGGPFALPTGPSNSIAPGTYKACTPYLAMLTDVPQIGGEVKIAQPIDPCYRGCSGELTGPSFNLLTVVGDRVDVACF